MKVKIIGAGSIGNHLANASRSFNWSVDIVDIDKKALIRAKEEIYPSRYGQWDDSIKLYTNDSAPKDIYDLICIGTPPDSHIELAIEAINENPKAILVEKPLCGPEMINCEKLYQLSKEKNIPIFVGYNHSLSKSINLFKDYTSNKFIGLPLTLDVEFREHWEGIFKAHPWLNGPEETYLGFSKKGGGASGEHSHAIHMWITIANFLNLGRVTKVQAKMKKNFESNAEYDLITTLNLTTETGFIGRCVQDVITKPSRKFARLQGERNFVEWHCTPEPGCDLVQTLNPLDNNEFNCNKIKKNRPDDFIEELKHISSCIKNNEIFLNSPISLSKGLEVMRIIAAAELSNQTGREVAIDYNHIIPTKSLVLV